MLLEHFVYYQKPLDSESTLMSYPLMRQFIYPTPFVSAIDTPELMSAVSTTADSTVTHQYGAGDGTYTVALQTQDTDNAFSKSIYDCC